MTPFLLILFFISWDPDILSPFLDHGSALREFIPLKTEPLGTWRFRFLDLELPIGPYPTYSPLSLNDWNQYFYGNEKLEEEEKDQLLSKIPSDGYDFSFVTGAEIFRLAKGRSSLWIGGFGGARGHLPKDMIELVLKGNDLDREYQLGGMEVQGALGLQIGVDRVFLFDLLKKPVLLLASLRGMIGLKYFSVKCENGRLLTDYDGIDALLEAEREESNGGFGLALDLGLRRELAKNLSLSLSLEGLGPPMVWVRGSKVESVLLEITRFRIVDLLEDPSDSLIHETKETLNRSIMMPIPLEISMAITWQFSEGRSGLLGVGYSLLETPFTSKGGWAALGIESKLIRSIEGRIGARLGGEGGYAVGAGLSLPLWRIKLDVGFENVGGLLWSSRGGRLGLGFSTRER